LEAELKRLWQRRAEVTAALAAAAAEGDRSENAEYIYRKKELRGLDRRIHYLQKRMPALKIIAELPADRSRIFFGAKVTLEDEQGCELAFRIVGPDEIDPKISQISIDSPMARALLKKSADDEIIVTTSLQQKRYWIVEINY
jgi:transcription elongation factor GreB